MPAGAGAIRLGGTSPQLCKHLFTMTRSHTSPFLPAIVLLAAAGFAGTALAVPGLIQHVPATPVFGEASGITMREPDAPREDEPVTLWLKVGPSFSYQNVWIYYTTDGSEPLGQFGVSFQTTTSLRSDTGGVTFVRNQPNGFGGNDDWWRATLPAVARLYGRTIRYKISVQDGGTETFANGGAAYSYDVKLAWPGQGAAFPGAEGIGYPPVHFWKEEGVVGNNWINAMLDSNGSVFDVYYPGAGAVQGVGTKNEGYVDGPDTFPAGLPLDNRGQMHLNIAMPGIRFNGRTHWLSNSTAASYSGITQQYVADTNTIRTVSTLTADGANIRVEQYDFSPKGITYPNGGTGKGMVIKRMVLTNQSSQPRDLNVYYYADTAINGGDSYDGSFVDTARGAMVHYDNTQRTVTGTGSIGAGQEYNPTTFSGYDKNVSIYLAMAMKSGAAGSAGGTLSRDSWRDTSGDSGIGWIGQKVSIPAGQTREVSFIIAGGFDPFAGAAGTYTSQITPVIDWFQAADLTSAMNTTDAYWQSFLDSGVTAETPDPAMNTLFRRGLLATMLHFDEKSGGLIAGFRNGAYPFVWPRDMAWAGVTLARTGHTDIVRQMTAYLRDTTFRAFETWTPANTPGFAAAGGSPFYGTRKGFWRQKYTTDGYIVWGAPQVDETAVFPWMTWYNYLVEGDASYFNLAEPGNPANTTYAAVKDAAIAMSQTSTVDGSRLNLRPSYPGSSTQQMYSNNIWEDSYDTFAFSNANIVRGLRDAAQIAGLLGQPADATDFASRANAILAGLNDKLDWNRENTDISLLGIVYPWETHTPDDPKAVRIINRINGVAADGNGQTKPLVRFAGQYQNNASDWVGLIDRYYGDGYWGNPANGPTPGGPWFLSTMWYGVYYAMRQDLTAGTADIDNHLFRLQRTADHNGPLGLGAEQMAPANSLLYPGQTDFTLQTAWPNAWESMSFYVDAIMMFIDYTPDAPGNTLRIEPKLPSAWNAMSFRNLRVGGKRFDIAVTQDAAGAVHTITGVSGGATAFSTVLRLSPGTIPCGVTVSGGTLDAFSFDAATGRLSVTGQLNAAAGGSTVIQARTTCACSLADVAGGGDTGTEPDGTVDGSDFIAFINSFAIGDAAVDATADVAGGGDTGEQPDGTIDGSDFIAFINAFAIGC